MDNIDNKKQDKNTEKTQTDESQEEQESSTNNQNQCLTELQEFKQQYLYLTAEFENYKKRTAKERTEWLISGESSVIKKLLPIVDNFERAFNLIESQKSAEEIVTHLKGFELILKSLYKLLDQYDVKEVEYGNFNPAIHEALLQVESDNHKSGEIVEVLEKGYTHKNNLLRPGKVSVAK